MAARVRGALTACAATLLCGVLAAGPAIADTSWEIVPGESELRILVFRAGAFARLGHNHVVSTTDISGTVTVGASPADSRLELTVPVRSFVIDDPAVLEEEGSAFAGERSDEDAAATRRNMLGPDLLHAGKYHEVRVVSEDIGGAMPEVTIHARIAIKGSNYVVALPAFVTVRDGRLVASGSAEIAHSDVGLSPFEAALGALRVAEEMLFRYRIVARESAGAVADGAPADPAADS